LKSCEALTVPVETGAATTALVYSTSGSAGAAFVLAHGAGAGQRSPFIIDFATTLSALEIDVISFNFLYTEQKRRVPDRGPILEACYRAVIETVQRELASARRALFIGGKSMGGRIATQVAAADAALALRGLVLLGYPLHPPGRPAQRRDAHLPNVRRPMLFVQGSRDAFGTPEELRPLLDTLSPSSTLFPVEGGDHSFKVSRNPERQQAVYADVQQTISGWIRARA
jgi:predicted alpha/beta-hydrolase family hydrolase